jgi:hypothetical protein
LVVEFSALPGAGSPIAFQRHLADAILESEGQASLSKRGSPIRRHIHLLRSIGDAFVWSVLPEHFIRTLRRHPGSSPSLGGQGNDLGFVFAVAEQLWRSGYVPVCTDFTHVLRVGDIVAWSPAHTLILECKNAPVPSRLPTGGRSARQRSRGEERAGYLARSYAAEQDGITRVALPAVWPSHNWGALRRALDALNRSIDRVGVVRLGKGDWLVAIRKPPNDVDFEFPNRLRRLLARGGKHLKFPTVGIHTELVDEPSELVRSPISFPVAADIRHDLLEGSLLLLRGVDLAMLETCAVIGGQTIRIEIADPQDAFPIRGRIGATEVPFSFRHLSVILFGPVSARAMRRSLLLNLTRWQRSQELFGSGLGAVPQHLLAAGDKVTYATVYRDEHGEPLVVTRAVDIGLADEDETYVVHRPRAELRLPQR